MDDVIYILRQFLSKMLLQGFASVWILVVIVHNLLRCVPRFERFNVVVVRVSHARGSGESENALEFKVYLECETTFELHRLSRKIADMHYFGWGWLVLQLQAECFTFTTVYRGKALIFGFAQHVYVVFPIVAETLNCCVEFDTVFELNAIFY